MEITWLVLVCAAAVGALCIVAVVAGLKALRRHSMRKEPARNALSYGYKVSARDPGA
jgi:hypothetical protein